MPPPLPWCAEGAVGGKDRGDAPHPQVVRGPHQLLDSGSAMGCATRPRTVGQWLERLGISRRRDLDPTSMPDRVPEVFPAHYQGHVMTWMSRKSRSDPHRGQVARSRAGHRRDRPQGGKGAERGAPSCIPCSMGSPAWPRRSPRRRADNLAASRVPTPINHITHSYN